jgi:hypothetical protein
MGPEDCAILVTHQPRWLMDWFFEEAACHNLRQLVRQHLRGRARVHLAGKAFHSDMASFFLGGNGDGDGNSFSTFPALGGPCIFVLVL